MRSIYGVVFGFSLLTACNGEKAATAETPDSKAEKKSASQPKAAAKPAPAAKDAGENGEVLATVNGTAIRSKDFEKAASRKVPADGKALNLDEKKEVLEKLLNDEVLYLKAFERELYRDPKVKKVMVNALLREDVYSKVRNSDFTDEELEKYFNAHKEDFTIPAKVQFSRILIKSKKDRDMAAAKAEADRVYQQLSKNPESFKNIAEKTSDGPYRRRGGDVGFVSKKGKPGLDTVIVEKAFKLGKGQLSSPFESKEGYNIILIKEKRNPVTRTFKQMKGTVLRKLKTEKLSQVYEEYTASLRKGAKIDVDDQKLGALSIKPAPKPSMGFPKGGKGLNLNKLKGPKGGKKGFKMSGKPVPKAPAKK